MTNVSSWDVWWSGLCATDTEPGDRLWMDQDIFGNVFYRFFKIYILVRPFKGFQFGPAIQPGTILCVQLFSCISNQRIRKNWDSYGWTIFRLGILYPLNKYCVCIVPMIRTEWKEWLSANCFWLSMSCISDCDTAYHLILSEFDFLE